MRTAEIIAWGVLAGAVAVVAYKYFTRVNNAPPVLAPGQAFGPANPADSMTSVEPGPITVEGLS
jgi:hypothetical protein